MWLAWEGGERKQKRKGKNSKFFLATVSEWILCYSSYLPSDQEGIWNERDEKETQHFSSLTNRERGEWDTWRVSPEYFEYFPALGCGCSIHLCARGTCFPHALVPVHWWELEYAPVPVLKERHTSAELAMHPKLPGLKISQGAREEKKEWDFMYKLKLCFLDLSFSSLASLTILKSRKLLCFSSVYVRMSWGNSGKHKGVVQSSV